MRTNFDYQSECIAAIHREWQSGRQKTIACLPTGTGKTRMALEAVKDLHFLYVVHRDFLTSQVVREATCPISIRSGKTRNGTTKLPVVATIQWLSAGGNLENLLKETEFDALVIDEAHHSTATSYLDVINKFDGKPVLGITATLQRTDCVPLSSVFNSLAYFKPINYFVKNGYLSPIKAYIFECDLELRGVPTSRDGEDFVLGKKLLRAIDVSNWKAVALKAWREHANGLKTIAFCLSVEHSKELCQFLNDAGIPSAHIDANTPTKERNYIIDNFKSGKFLILCNMAVFTEGFDVPSVEAVIMARLTKSQLNYIQSIGRVLRVFPGKEFAIVLDMTDTQHTLAQFGDIEPLYRAESERDFKKMPGYGGIFIDNYLMSLNQRRAFLQFEKARDSYARIVNLLRNRKLAWGVFGDRAIMVSARGTLAVFSPSDTNALSKSFPNGHRDGGKYHVFLKRGLEIKFIQSADIIDAMEAVSDIAEQYADNLSDGTAKWRSLPPTHKQMDMLLEAFHLDGCNLEGINRGEAALIIEYIHVCDYAGLGIGGNFGEIRKKNQAKLEEITKERKREKELEKLEKQTVYNEQRKQRELEWERIRREKAEIAKKQEQETQEKLKFWRQNSKKLGQTNNIEEKVWMLLGRIDFLNAWEKEFINDNAYRLASGGKTTSRQDEFIEKIHNQQLNFGG